MSSVASCHLRLPEPALRLGPVDSALSRYNVKPGTGTTVLVATFFVVFGVELASHSVGDETLLLKFGALPGSAKQARRPGQSTSWAVIRDYNDASTVIETHEHKGEFTEV
jgi:hypothetical protein